MKVSILTTVEPTLAEFIPAAEQLLVASCYIRASAVRQLLLQLRPREASRLESVNFLFGYDVSTDSQALTLLLEATNAEPERIRVRYVANTRGRLFHPKVYWLRCGDCVHLIIGSGNLTAAGQHTNDEVFCHVEAPASSELARSWAEIAAVWLGNSFSAPLTEMMVRTTGVHQARLHALMDLDRKRDELCGLLDISAHQIESFVRQHAKRPRTPYHEPRSGIDWLRSTLSEGYIADIRLSTARLTAQVPAQEIAGAVPRHPPGEPPAFVLVQRLAGYVKLLPPEAMASFDKLQRDAEEVLAAHSFPLRDGAYVPVSAHPAFYAAVEKLRERHNQLIDRYVRPPNAIREHLEDCLEDDIRRAWAIFHPAGDAPLPAPVIEEVRRRVQMRSAELWADPVRAVPLHIATNLHPLVTRPEWPNHPAWQVRGEGSETELLNAVLDVLCYQQQAIQGITRLRQYRARRAEYERVVRMISIPGQTTTALMAALRPWMAEGGARTRAWRSAASQIRAEADQHLRRLETLRTADVQLAVDALAEEYGAPGRVDYSVPEDVLPFDGA